MSIDVTTTQQTRRVSTPVFAFRLVCWLLVALASTRADARPNIVLILSDDHHWRDYSFTGENPYVSTPNIDQLAAEGVLIQRGYVPTSVCRPSLMTLFTGAATGLPFDPNAFVTNPSLAPSKPSSIKLEA